MTYKTFQDGVVLPASDLQMLMDQSVIGVANADALGAIPTPPNGMVAYVQNIGLHVRRVTGGWVPLSSRVNLADAAAIDTFPFPVVGLMAREIQTGFDYQYSPTGWFLIPGQTLAAMTGPSGNVGGLGTLIGTVISTPPLRVGQRVKIISEFSQFSSAAGSSQVMTRWRNHADAVTFADADGNVVSRTVAPGGGQVSSGRGCNALVTAGTAARISAAIFSADAVSSVYGADGTFLRIESA